MGSAVALLANYFAFRLHSNLPTAGFIDLLIVVLTSRKFGFSEATGCSLVAVACLDYFFAPPIYSFHVADPEKWFALVTFEIVALIVSRLSNQLQNETQESLLQRRNAERPYELSRNLLLLDQQRPAGPQIASLIERHTGVDLVVIFHGYAAGLYTAGACTEEDKAVARSTYLSNTSRDDRESLRWLLAGHQRRHILSRCSWGLRLVIDNRGR